ncbi:glycosyltransferase [Bacillus changyiensis]|uniref:glycosyltransferase n=1 Tax=Bacillus changyiensis TaxID=3004103 RepID=UPI0022E281AA|nr:glycosyltransferase [Bacillus changyiensis]MDA1476849.1 glycosyltransferase [Bacillus changyiensis]
MEYFLNYYPIAMILLTFVSFFGIKISSRFKKMLIIICLITNGVYIVWRFGFTLPTASPADVTMGIILVVTELIGFLQLLVFYTLIWKERKRTPILLGEKDHWPSVDIFIATYNEDRNVLKKSVAGCLKLDYPKELVNIYLCDDGKRKDIKKLAEKFGVHYLTRKTNEHAKAGNLNHAMSCTTGELIVTLDADMVPLPSFLKKTVGYFKEEKVAFVQTPQAFYNEDPYQYNLFSGTNIPNEQDFFMRRLQAGKDRFNAVMYVGSNTVFRRTALDEIGGFATGVITEDMATGMLLQTKYEAAFVGEVLAVGLAPETWTDLLKQRDRWCRGNIQCGKKWNPLLLKGLTPMQRILYFDGILFWFFGVFKMVYILAPLLFLLFGIHSLKTNVFEITMFWLPAFLSSYLSFKSVSDKQRSMSWSHIYDTSMAPHLAMSALSEFIFKKRFDFKVTPKGVHTDQRKFRYTTAYPCAILFALTIAALGKTLYDYLVLGTFDINITSYNLFWVLYNAIGLLLAMLVAFDRPRFRSSERFMMNKPAAFSTSQTDQEHQCELEDLSDTGARVRLPYTAEAAEYYQVDNLIIDQVGKLPVQVIWTTKDGDDIEIGLRFKELDSESYVNLIGYMFTEQNAKKADREKRANTFSTVMRFLMKTEKNPEAFKRKYIREAFEGKGTLSISGEDSLSEIAIKDISPSGCQIETNVPLEMDGNVWITFDDQNLGQRLALVCWTKRKRKRYTAGLKFLDEQPNEKPA